MSYNVGGIGQNSAATSQGIPMIAGKPSEPIKRFWFQSEHSPADILILYE